MGRENITLRKVGEIVTVFAGIATIIMGIVAILPYISGFVTGEENKLSHDSTNIDNSNTGSSKTEPSKLEPKKPEINITSPSNNSLVDRLEIVKGTSSDIPEGYQIWILGFSYDGKYYPRPESEIIPENEEWSITMDVGSEEDTHVTYEIIAMLANTEANEILRSYATSYIDTGKWPDVEEEDIPPGVEVYDRKTVTRK